MSLAIPPVNRPRWRLRPQKPTLGPAKSDLIRKVIPTPTVDKPFFDPRGSVIGFTLPIPWAEFFFSHTGCSLNLLYIHKLKWWSDMRTACITVNLVSRATNFYVCLFEKVWVSCNLSQIKHCIMIHRIIYLLIWSVMFSEIVCHPVHSSHEYELPGS